jgi:hypothetical protein
MLFGAVLFGLSLACAYGQEPGSDPDLASGKLPRDVLPHAYKIDLVPDLGQLSIATGRERVGFNGTVQIDIEVRQPVGDRPQRQRYSFARVTIDGGEQGRGHRRTQMAKIILPGAERCVISWRSVCSTILTHQEGCSTPPIRRRAALGAAIRTERRAASSRLMNQHSSTFSLSVTTCNLPCHRYAVIREQVDGTARKVVTWDNAACLLLFLCREYDRIVINVKGTMSARCWHRFAGRMAAWRARHSMTISASNIRRPPTIF